MARGFRRYNKGLYATINRWHIDPIRRLLFTERMVMLYLIILFVCLDGWYFNSPEASFLALISVVIDDRRLTSIETWICRLWRLTFGTREAFFRLLVQRYNNLELKTNFSATDFLGTSVSVWLIVLYNDIPEINCCILIELEENEGSGSEF